MLIRRAYKYRLCPSKRQVSLLTAALGYCCELYNAALQERISAWKHGHNVGFYAQSAQLPQLKTIRPEYQNIFSQVLQNVLHRLDKAYKSFFRRIKTGQKPGFPRFRSRRRYDSFTYPQDGFKLIGDRLVLSKVGPIHIKLHRPLRGKVKTLTVKREGQKWYAAFTTELEIEPFLSDKPAIALDLGIEYFATGDTGVHYENPRWYVKAQRKLARLQRRHAKRRSGKSRLALNYAHRKVANQRRDFHHKLSKKLVDSYEVIIVEDLAIDKMTKDYHGKSVNDAGWAQFIQMLDYKAEEAGSQVIRVNPAGTSQMCPSCGAVKKKYLQPRRHLCACGCALHRDHAAALNIKALGLQSLGQIVPKSPRF